MTLGAVPYVIISLAIFGLVLIVLGTVVDVIMVEDNNMALDPSLPYSMQRGATMQTLVWSFRALGVVAIMGSGIFLVMNGVQERTGGIG